MTFEEAYQFIESWDNKTIKKVLKEVEAGSALETQLLARYQSILDHIEGTDLSILSKVKSKLVVKKSLQKEWQLDTKTIEILNKIPVKSITFTKFKKIESWIFYLMQLKELRFQECKSLMAIPDAIENLVNLESLVIYKNNKIKEIPESIAKLNKLQEIDFSHCMFEELPTWIFTPSLHKFEMNFGKLKKIPIEIGNAVNLEEFEAMYNQFESIPEEIGKLTKLTRLIINGNKKIKTLPDSFANLKKLRVLDISSNQFEKIPECVYENTALDHLELDLNPITEISPKIENLKSLTTLYLANTKVSSFPKEILALSKLYGLNIQSTPLQENHSFGWELDKKLVQNFLKSLFKEETPIVRVYQDLESRDSAKIQAALQQLEENPKLKKQAEKRYLAFIQARTNNPNASLAQFEEAALSEKEESFLLNEQIVGNYHLSFQMMEDEESKLIVDFSGAMIKGVADVDAYCKSCYDSKDVYDVMNLAEKAFPKAKNAIFEESTVYKNGWFGKVYQSFAKANISDVLFDHTDFNTANESLVLKEFHFFLNTFKMVSTFTFDIFQSDAPDLTELFWLGEFVPETKWGDTEVSLPISPLSFSRKARVREGDFSNWEEIESASLVKNVPNNDNIVFKKTCQKIETWDNYQIKKALKEVQEGSELETQLLTYYGEIINHLEGEGLKFISKIKSKLSSKKFLQKEWSPTPQTIEILNNIPIQELVFANFKEIQPWIFHLTQVKELTFRDSRSLDYPNSFEKLVNLKRVSFFKIKKVNVIPDVFKFCTNARELIIRECEFEELPTWIFTSSMERLVIDIAKKLPQLPNEVENEINLKKVIIEQCNFEELPAWIFTPSLEELEIIHVDLKKLPNEIENATNLPFIRISCPQLEELPTTLGNMKSLTGLSISSSKKLKTIPESISLLNLIQINIAECDLETIPEWILKQTSLKILQAYKNPIKEIPSTIENLKKLQTLYLEDTIIAEFPAEILQLTNLHELNISRTPLYDKSPFEWKYNNLEETQDFLKSMF